LELFTYYVLLFTYYVLFFIEAFIKAEKIG